MTTTYVFYGEDRRHIEKGATAYHGFRLDLTKSVDLGAIKAKATAMAADKKMASIASKMVWLMHSKTTLDSIVIDANAYIGDRACALQPGYLYDNQSLKILITRQVFSAFL